MFAKPVHPRPQVAVAVDEPLDLHGGSVCDAAMALESLERHLRESFHPPAASRMDAVLRIAAGKEFLTFRVRHGTLDFDVPAEVQPDATFLFEDAETAWALLTGSADAFEAFMEGRFSADGHLMWAFALMAMFQSPSLPVTPTE